MSVEIKRLQEKHKRVIDLVIQGYSRKEVAQKLGWTREGVSLFLKTSLAQHELARRRSEMDRETKSICVDAKAIAENILSKNAVSAASKLVDQLDSENESVAQRSALNILDRVGISPKTQVEINKRTVDISLTGDQLEKIQKGYQDMFGKELDLELIDDSASA